MSDPMKPTIIECPFCSYPSDAMRGPKPDSFREYSCPEDHFVQCGNCHGRGPLAKCKETAIVLWNMRLPTK